MAWLSLLNVYLSITVILNTSSSSALSTKLLQSLIFRITQILKSTWSVLGSGQWCVLSTPSRPKSVTEKRTVALRQVIASQEFELIFSCWSFSADGNSHVEHQCPLYLFMLYDQTKQWNWREKPSLRRLKNFDTKNFSKVDGIANS